MSSGENENFPEEPRRAEDASDEIEAPDLEPNSADTPFPGFVWPAGPETAGRQQPPARRRGRRAPMLFAAVVATIALTAGSLLALHPWSASSNIGANPGPSHASNPAVGVPVQPALPPVSASPIAPSSRPRGAAPQTGGGPASASDMAIAAKVIPGLVNVRTTLGTQGQAAGTGIVLTASGEVLTNHHVIQWATSIQVDDLGNGRTYSATVVGYDASADLAVLQLQGAKGLATVTLGNSAAVAVGDSVIGIGNAGGSGSPSVVTGKVTALNQSITATDEGGANPEQLTGLVQTNVPLQPGDSGGPLVDQNGHVIGVDSAGSGSASVRFRPSSATEGYSVPIDAAMAIVKQIAAGQSSATVHIGPSGYLGITVSRIQAAAGAQVANVQPGSPAASAGLLPGDVVLSVGGQKLDSASALTTAMASYRTGDQVKLSWLDAANKTHSAEVTLTSGPVR